MKQILAPAFALILAAAPLAAQDDQPSKPDGFSLIEEGAKLLLRGLLEDMEPAIDELQGLTDEMGDAMQLLAPTIADLLGRIDDLRNYQAPEILPNGDIIIRRHKTAPVFTPDPETGEIEL